MSGLADFFAESVRTPVLRPPDECRKAYAVGFSKYQVLIEGTTRRLDPYNSSRRPQGDCFTLYHDTTA